MKKSEELQSILTQINVCKDQMRFNKYEREDLGILRTQAQGMVKFLNDAATKLKWEWELKQIKCYWAIYFVDIYFVLCIFSCCDSCRYFASTLRWYSFVSLPISLSLPQILCRQFGLLWEAWTRIWKQWSSHSGNTYEAGMNNLLRTL